MLRLQRYLKNFGERFGESIAGHNWLIKGKPTQYSKTYARHFMLIEATAALPAFALSISHYFSSFCGRPDRVAMIAPVLNECTVRAEMLQLWTQQNKDPKKDVDPMFILYRMMIVFYQLSFFPVFCGFAALSPGATHAALSRINYILSQKYGAIECGFPNPALHRRYCSILREGEDFHRRNNDMKTDVAAAVILILSIVTTTMQLRRRDITKKTQESPAF